MPERNYDIKKYEHDCDACTFVGVLALDGGTSFDIYTCDQGGNWPTVIIRFGDDGPNYMSGESVNLYQLGIGLHVVDPEVTEQMRENLKALNRDIERGR